MLVTSTVNIFLEFDLIFNFFLITTSTAVFSFFFFGLKTKPKCNF